MKLEQLPLAICIPTFNNARALAITLESIANQLDSQTSREIEVCVSDNASADDSEDVVAEFRETIENLSYRRNSRNIGPGPNQLEALKMASARFLWLLGDDQLLPGAIANVLGQLSSCPEDLTAATVCWESDWGDSPTRRPLLDRELASKVPMTVVTKSVDGFLALKSPTFPFMSALIFRSSAINWHLISKYSGSRWFQLYVLFSCLSSSPLVLHISEVCVLDDHAKDGIEVFPKEKWPSDIFLQLFWSCLNDLVSLGYLKEHQAHEFAVRFYEYVFCDPLEFPAIWDLHYWSTVRPTKDSIDFASDLRKALDRVHLRGAFRWKIVIRYRLIRLHAYMILRRPLGDLSIKLRRVFGLSNQ